MTVIFLVIPSYTPGSLSKMRKQYVAPPSVVILNLFQDPLINIHIANIMPPNFARRLTLASRRFTPNAPVRLHKRTFKAQYRTTHSNSTNVVQKKPAPTSHFLRTPREIPGQARDDKISHAPQMIRLMSHVCPSHVYQLKWCTKGRGKMRVHLPQPHSVSLFFFLR